MKASRAAIQSAERMGEVEAALKRIESNLVALSSAVAALTVAVERMTPQAPSASLDDAARRASVSSSRR